MAFSSVVASTYSFSLAREIITNYDAFHHYLDLLGETLTKYDLKDSPSQIYNCDESGMPLEHKLPHVLVIKGTEKVRQETRLRSLSWDAAVLVVK